MLRLAALSAVSLGTPLIGRAAMDMETATEETFTEEVPIEETPTGIVKLLQFAPMAVDMVASRIQHDRRIDHPATVVRTAQSAATKSHQKMIDTHKSVA